MVVVLNGVVVLAENMDLRSVYATGFEFLLDSIQIVKIGAYAVMPFHAVFPVITSCKPEYACHQTESSPAKELGHTLEEPAETLFQTTDSC